MRRKTLLRRGHYWLGLGLALPLVILAITGILLNHTSDLQLDQRFSGQTWLLDIYGIYPSAPKQGYRLADQWVSQARDGIWLDDKKLASTTEPLQGAVLLHDLLVIAETTVLHLYTRDGRSVERLELPPRVRPISGIAVADERLLLKSAQGLFSTNTSFSEWPPYAEKWPGNRAQLLPNRLQRQITKKIAAHTLTWEKILLDTHSGRIFGRWGPFLMDIVAVITLALAVTGCLLWALQRRRQARR